MPREYYDGVENHDEQEYANPSAAATSTLEVYRGPLMAQNEEDSRWDASFREALKAKYPNPDQICPRSNVFTALHRAVNRLASLFHMSTQRDRSGEHAVYERRGCFGFHFLLGEGYMLWLALTGTKGDMLFPVPLCLAPPSAKMEGVLQCDEGMRPGYYSGRIRFEWEPRVHWRMVASADSAPLMERTPWSMEQERRRRAAAWEETAEDREGLYNPTVRLYLADLRWVKPIATQPSSSSDPTGSFFQKPPLVALYELYVDLRARWDRATHIDDVTPSRRHG